MFVKLTKTSRCLTVIQNNPVSRDESIILEALRKEHRQHMPPNYLSPQTAQISTATHEQVAQLAKEMGYLLQNIQQKNNDLAKKLTKLTVYVDLFA